ncbi:MAG: histidine phosphatase family protein [Pseudomonadota bacterium]
MTDVYIVRHGNTFDAGDTVTRVGARTDLALSLSGQIQAGALATHFAEITPGGFDRAFCSPLQRTRQTAEAILDASVNAPGLETLEFLREVDYGPDENRPEDEVIARIGQAALTAWETDAVPPPGWEIDPETVKTDWVNFLNELEIQAPERPILVVTSNGIARFVLDAITDRQVALDSIKLKTGAYGHIRVARDVVSLLSWNVRP